MIRNSKDITKDWRIKVLKKEKKDERRLHSRLKGFSPLQSCSQGPRDSGQDPASSSLQQLGETKENDNLHILEMKNVYIYLISVQIFSNTLTRPLICS